MAAMLVAGACSDGGGSDDPVDDDGPSVDAGDDDCQVVPSEVTCQGLDGAWVFEDVSRSADTGARRPADPGQRGAEHLPVAGGRGRDRPPETVIAAGADGCVNPRAIHDGDGNLHVLAECGPIFDQDIVWATDDGPGPWQSEPLPGTADHDDLSVTVALAGGTVHAAWVADLPCGASFAPPCNLTRTEADNEWMPSSLQLDPQRGTLHLLYESFVPDSEPLDTEVIHAFVL